LVDAAPPRSLGKKGKAEAPPTTGDLAGTPKRGGPEKDVQA